MLAISVFFNVCLALVLGYFLTKKMRARRDRSARASALARKAEQKQETVRNVYSARASVFDILPHGETEIVFLGDSITSIAPWPELFDNPKIKNRGIVGDATKHMLTRLDPIIEAAPKKIFLMLGINDLTTGSRLADIVSNYADILRRLARGIRGVEIYVQSVLPVNNTLYGELKSNDAVISLNAQLKRLAEAHGFVYVDLFPLFAQADKQLKPEYTSNGLHLSGKGYQVWKAAIEPYVIEPQAWQTSPRAASG